MQIDLTKLRSSADEHNAQVEADRKKELAQKQREIEMRAPLRVAEILSQLSTKCEMAAAEGRYSVRVMVLEVGDCRKVHDVELAETIVVPMHIEKYGGELTIREFSWSDVEYLALTGAAAVVWTKCINERLNPRIVFGREGTSIVVHWGGVDEYGELRR